MLFGRYQFSSFFYGLKQEIVKGENMRQDHRFQNFDLTETHVFSPTATGEFRFGYGRRRITVNFLDPNDAPPIIRWTYTGFTPFIGNASLSDASLPERFSVCLQYEHPTGHAAHAEAGNGCAARKLLMTACRISCEEWSPRSPSLARPSPYRAQFCGQDEFHATPDLKLTLGFRIERVGTPGEVHNDVSAGIWLRYPHLCRALASPGRLHLANHSSSDWQPDRVKPRFEVGSACSTVCVFQSIFSQIGVNKRFNSPNGAALGWSNLDMSVVDPTGGFVVTPGPPTAQMGLANVDANLRMPYAEQMESHCAAPIALERCFASILYLYLLSISIYIGNRGIGCCSTTGATGRICFTSTQPTFYKGVAIFPGVTFNQIDPNLFDANPAGRYDLAPAAQDGRPAERWALRIDPKRPTPRRSYYNALELQYTQRTKHGLSLQAAFTWSRNIDRGRRRRTSERVT